MSNRRTEPRAGQPSFTLEMLSVPRNTSEHLGLVERVCELRYEKPRAIRQ